MGPVQPRRLIWLDARGLRMRNYGVRTLSRLQRSNVRRATTNDMVLRMFTSWAVCFW